MRRKFSAGLVILLTDKYFFVYCDERRADPAKCDRAFTTHLHKMKSQKAILTYKNDRLIRFRNAPLSIDAKGLPDRSLW